uniref:HTH-like domain-containing protein n=1 Tax=Clytia hemisphaerica TaxID=252671 RepID=A0A7M5V8C0_9CNID|eukprot:TCONS_00019256-protein
MAALLNEKKDVVVGYFNDGYTYAEIIEMLRVKDRVKTSMSTLKRFFRSNRLYKRPLQNRRDEDLVLKQAISEELEGSSGNLGYRRMHRILLTKGLMCRREDVRRFLLELDPVGVNIRRKHRLRRRKYRSRGPGYVWHIDFVFFP